MGVETPGMDATNAEGRGGRECMYCRMNFKSEAEYAGGIGIVRFLVENGLKELIASQSTAWNLCRWTRDRDFMCRERNGLFESHSGRKVKPRSHSLCNWRVSNIAENRSV